MTAAAGGLLGSLVFLWVAGACCREPTRTTEAGMVGDDTLDLVAPVFVAAFREAAQAPVECATIDTIPVSMTARSYQPWRDAATEGSTP